MTAGEGGFWTTFEWDSAFKLAEPIVGLPYSGSYDFAKTSMYWPTTHMVQPKEKALQCDDCHSTGGTQDPGRMDWKALGYAGDPIEWGGRFSKQ